MTTLSEQILTITNQYEKKCSEYEKRLLKKMETINTLNSNLRLEKFKTTVLSTLLNNLTDIKTEELFKEEDDGFHVYTPSDGKIPIIVHDALKKDKYIVSATRKKNFRKINNIELEDENPEDLETKVTQAEQKIGNIIVENKLDVSYTDTIKTIEEQFCEILKLRACKKNLGVIKSSRMKLLGKLSLQDYIKLVETHTQRLQKIFTEKKFDVKKIEMHMNVGLSSLEQRLISYGKYYNTELLPEDIQVFKIGLDVTMKYPKRYILFNMKDLNEKMYNYSIAVCSLKDILKRSIVNPYGFNNLVFLSKTDLDEVVDPYQFYILESMSPTGMRHWKMDCRLTDISRSIMQHLLTYSVNLFRKIYYDVFNDNTYRENYITIAPIMSQDCEQLKLNVLILTDLTKLTDMLKEIVVEYCPIKPSKLDKFNMFSDDKMTKKNYDLDAEEKEKTVRRLFDNISDEDINKFLNQREV